MGRDDHVVHVLVVVLCRFSRYDSGSDEGRSTEYKVRDFQGVFFDESFEFLHDGPLLVGVIIGLVYCAKNFYKPNKT